MDKSEFKYTILGGRSRTLIVERVRGHPRDNYVHGNEYSSINCIYNKLK
jgi:hypothetical protein